jgi:hypothetical protein
MWETSEVCEGGLDFVKTNVDRKAKNIFRDLLNGLCALACSYPELRENLLDTQSSGLNGGLARRSIS